MEERKGIVVAITGQRLAVQRAKGEPCEYYEIVDLKSMGGENGVPKSLIASGIQILEADYKEK